jgi:radical SAM superfamily enzyme YgiQ (UPF0313 family)
MKIQLIRPPLDTWYSSKNEQIQENTSFPIGLCILGKKAKEAGVDVEIIDGLNRSLQYVIDRVIQGNADFVGITEMYSFHENALTIARSAKQNGSTTILGGPNVNPIATRILRKRDEIDYIVKGDGEQAIKMILEGKSVETIPNLVFRRNNDIITNPQMNSPLNTLFDLEDIVDRQSLLEKSISLASIKGCIKAEEERRCSFCSIDHVLKLMTPELVWEQIDLLNQKYGFTYFWESGDSFIVGNYPAKILAARPKHLSHIEWKIYACPNHITEESVEILKALNMKEVMIGIETSNESILKKARKNFNADDVERACSLLTKYGIDMHVGIIYGLPGESETTANNTYKFMKRMVNNYAIRKVLVSHALPLPGTELFEEIRKEENKRKQIGTTLLYNGDLNNDDIFNLHRLVEINLMRSGITFEQMQYYVEKTKSLIQEPGTKTEFGINK